MKYTYSILVMFIILLIAFSACSKLNEDILTPAQVEIHGEGNTNPESDNFHGYKVADSELEKKLTECQQCHGGDYSGGIIPDTDPNEDISIGNCNTCHSGIQVHSGPEYGVSDHFTYFYNYGKSFSDCWSCHSDDFSGGIASPSCETCHETISVHGEGTNALYHASYLPTITWDLDGCKQCHGSDYAGKDNRVSPSCLTCHANPGGPEACNTCHGQFGDPSKIAPPVGLANKADQNQYVGAHAAHMYDTKISYNLVCEECHVVPASVGSEGHIDDGDRAEIMFGQIRAEAATTPYYNPDKLSCGGTYCHGNFSITSAIGVITGNAFEPEWLEDDQAYCGSCHGQEIDGTLTPLPLGHFGTYLKEDCYLCHGNVVDNTGAIIGPDLHINGENN